MQIPDLPILSIALSIIICWALFAILCSIIQEAIAQVLAERGRFMKKYLFRQLEDASNGVNWASQLYLHGTIDLLSRAPNKPTNDISPQLFAEVIVEVVGSAHLVQMHFPEEEPKENATVSHSLEEQIIAKRLRQRTSLQNFRLAMEVLQPSDVVSFFRQALNTAELSAMQNQESDEGTIYRNLLATLESWYKQMTERLTLWYKKKIRRRLLFIGIALGLLANIDSIQLFLHFKEDPASRNALKSYYESNRQALEAYATSLDSTDVATKKQEPAVYLAAAQLYVRQLDSIQKKSVLPVGMEYNIFNKPPGEDKHSWLLKVLGILVSGLAASFGAPFWFDVLRKAYSSSVK